MLVKNYKKWKKRYQLRNLYSTNARTPFYDIASYYLPEDKNATIIDIGSGRGHFEEYLNLADKHKNLFLLDQNNTTIKSLRSKFKKVILYKAPDKLPFRDNSVSYVYCSHFVEHLYYHELYMLLKEIDRVLVKNGIIVINTPLLHSSFYSDLSHVKPYNPEVFIRYLCSKSGDHSADCISETYSVLALVYRMVRVDVEKEWGSLLPLIDLLIRLLNIIFRKLKLKKYIKNGYILVLKKN